MPYTMDELAEELNAKLDRACEQAGTTQPELIAAMEEAWRRCVRDNPAPGATVNF